MGAPTRVLIVDDEPALTRLLQINLEAAGEYQVRVVNHGPAALQAARQFDPDIVFLDVIMPDVDGPTVAEQFRSDALLRTIPVVFMTAVVSPEEAAEQQGYIGGQAFLAKPVDVNTIMQYINEHARRRAA